MFGPLLPCWHAVLSCLPQETCRRGIADEPWAGIVCARVEWHVTEEFLDRKASDSDQTRALAALLREIASAAIQTAEIVSLGHIAGAPDTASETVNSDGDVQKQLDIAANDIFIDALRRAPVAAVLSEELASPLRLQPGAPLFVAIDPLDGSSHIDANVSIGTIFSMLPAAADETQMASQFLRPGNEQLAAGLVIYGPQTSFVFTLGDGVHLFTLDRHTGVFRLVNPALAIPDDSIEYAVNASNYRHWDDSIRAYVDDCIRGADGPLGPRPQYALDCVARGGRLSHSGARRSVLVSR